MTDTDGLRIRPAARALVVTPDEHVLLVRFEFETSTVWAPPGGGIEPGESPVEALRRELHEEVGLVDVPIGPHVWNRLHVIPFTNGLWDGQRECFHLVPVPERFEPDPLLSWDDLRAECVHEIRWVHLDEIDDLVDERTLVRPDGFAELLRTVLRDGPPSDPIDVPV